MALARSQLNPAWTGARPHRSLASRQPAPQGGGVRDRLQVGLACRAAGQRLGRARSLRASLRPRAAGDPARSPGTSRTCCRCTAPGASLGGLSSSFWRGPARSCARSDDLAGVALRRAVGARPPEPRPAAARGTRASAPARCSAPARRQPRRAGRRSRAAAARRAVAVGRVEPLRLRRSRSDRRGVHAARRCYLRLRARFDETCSARAEGGR